MVINMYKINNTVSPMIHFLSELAKDDSLTARFIPFIEMQFGITEFCLDMEIIYTSYDNFYLLIGSEEDKFRTFKNAELTETNIRSLKAFKVLKGLGSGTILRSLGINKISSDNWFASKAIN